MRYTEVVKAPKIAVRRETACAMIENAKLIDEWIEQKKLLPANPGEKVPIFLVKELEALVASYVTGKRHCP